MRGGTPGRRGGTRGGTRGYLHRRIREAEFTRQFYERQIGGTRFTSRSTLCVGAAVYSADYNTYLLDWMRFIFIV